MPQTSILLNLQSNTNHQKQVINYLQNTPYSIPHTQYPIPNTDTDTKYPITHTQYQIPTPNLHWINTENESLKIKTVRELLTQASYSPYGNETQFYVLLHADLATIPAQNALLKIIEEPPKNTVIILTATNIEKILPTIHSRCQIISLTSKKADKNFPMDEKIQNFLDFFSNPNKLSYSELINTLETYKDKTSALNLTESLLNRIIEEKSHQKKPFFAQELLKTHQFLEKNINVKLALENCFFNIKKSTTL